MRPRISIRGSVRHSVRPSVGASVRPSVRPMVVISFSNEYRCSCDFIHVIFRGHSFLAR